ncbi:MAG: hypothetical protein K2X86_05660, partial [Cytophagaceae bacterium]|nr:hypothetical protein [Cytophagaceae bacterium]
MKTLKNILLFFLIGIHCLSFAQQTNNWYFGSAAGFPNTGIRIDFTSGSPVVSSCNPLMTEEGSSSISDASGNPLFYTDGITAWDASTNAVIPGGTGLLGGASATQSGIIMPRPGFVNQWLLFTSGVTGANGINYYVVSGTPGAFTVSAGTNMVGANTVGEGLFIIGSTKPGSAFWVIARDLGTTGIVRAWDVTNAGVVNTVEVTSVLSGPAFTNTDYTSKIGTIKSNTCQTKLAFTYLSAAADLTDFDATTGQVVANTARRITVASSGGNSGSYGIEFSPNDSYLYLTNLASANLYRHDIGANTTTLMGSVPVGEAGQLQLAPDGKIYMARMNGSTVPSYLGIIANPDAGGVFTANGLLVSGPTCGGFSGFSYRGLPTFPKSLVVTNPVTSPGDGTYCVSTGIPLSFTFAGSINPATISWTSTGGGATFAPSNTVVNPTVTFSTTGAKTVTITFNDICGRTYSDVMNFTIITPKVPAGTISCTPGVMTLTATGGVPGDYPNYVWYDAASGGNVLGIGSPVTLNYGDPNNAPGSVWVEVGGSASISSSNTNRTIGMAAGALTWAASGSPYGPVPFNVLADMLTLKSFVVKSWNTTGNFDVEIRNASNAIVFLKTYNIATANVPYTVNINTEFPQGSYTINLKNTTHQWYGGTWAGGTNAGEINVPTFGGAGTYGIANYVYDFKNFSVTTTCSNRIQINRACTLPVELISFEAVRGKGQVDLSWTTASEKNNNYFEIERSADGINYEAIGKVWGKGNSSEVTSYGMADPRPLSLTTYYRLVQYDIDGTKNIGPVRIVQASADEEIIVYPNP